MDNGLVAGSSPAGHTTQSCANPEFPVSAEYPRFSAVWGGCNRPFAVSAGNEDRPEADWGPSSLASQIRFPVRGEGPGQRLGSLVRTRATGEGDWPGKRKGQVGTGSFVSAGRGLRAGTARDLAENCVGKQGLASPRRACEAQRAARVGVLSCRRSNSPCSGSASAVLTTQFDGDLSGAATVPIA